MKDHPHAYGDKLSAFILFANIVGSSPRVWGQVIDLTTSEVLDGIIPTRMGTRILPAIRFIRLQDHPHAYGDKWRLLRQAPTPPGSSPRVWGQANIPDVKQPEQRIIPTRMGTS